MNIMYEGVKQFPDLVPRNGRRPHPDPVEGLGPRLFDIPTGAQPVARMSEAESGNGDEDGKRRPPGFASLNAGYAQSWYAVL